MKEMNAKLQSPLKHPHWDLQVIGQGRRNEDTLQRAVEIAAQLLAAGYWSNHQNTRIIIHHLCELHSYLQLSGQPDFCPHINLNVYPGIHDLSEGAGL